MLFKDNDEGINQTITGTEEKLTYTYTGLEYLTKYTFRVEYYNESGKLVAV